MKLTYKTTLAGVLAAGLLALSGCSASQNYPAPEEVAEQLSEKYGTAFETDGKAEPGELYVQYRLGNLTGKKFARNVIFQLIFVLDVISYLVFYFLIRRSCKEQTGCEKGES